MNRTTNHRTFMESAYAYTRARQPTPQLIADLCAAAAQMLADDSQDRVAVALSAARISVVREPRAK